MLASTVLLGGSSDQAGSRQAADRAAARVRDALGDRVRDAFGHRDADGHAGSGYRRAATDFTRERARAVRNHKAAVANAVAAASALPRRSASASSA